MGKLTTKLNIVANDSTSYGQSFTGRDLEMIDNYDNVVQLKERLDNSDAFIKLAACGSSISGVKAGAGARLIDAKLIVIKNCGKTAIELSLESNEHAHANETRSNAMYSSMIVAPDDFLVLPNQRIVNYSNLTSAGNAATFDNQATSALKTDSGAKLAEAFSDAADTNIVIDDSSGGAANTFFRVGDTIRVNNEILRITAINDDDGDGAFTPTSLTVERALFGSTGATHANNDELEFAFFNEYSDFDKYTKCQTNRSGKYKTANLILNADQRVATAYSRGFVRGSFAIKFYNKGYQELGMSGQTTTTSTGLATSTEYKFNITGNGGSVLTNLAFTTDSSNVNWGGTNGVLSKINDSLATQYATSGGNLYDKLITVSIVNGDIRFESQDRTSASAVLLAAPSSGTSPFGVGNIPAIGSVEAPVAAALPDDTVRTSNYVSSPNEGVFAYDDGQGNILGAATGTINYETSAVELTSGPADAEFVVSAAYGSAHSGGINETTNFENGLLAIYARSCNAKIDGEVEIIGFM
tara:strand:+ start:2559 stop:4136 length:1578 start_codon:yes stop_codon:yes gene_type:complete